MPRDPSSLVHVVLRLLTVAMTLVVGVRIGPQPATGSSSASAVSLTAHIVGEDAVRPASRVEPRGVAAPVPDRLAPVAASQRLGVISLPAEVVDAARVVDIRSRSEQRPIVKHVPRMERGDPPRA